MEKLIRDIEAYANAVGLMPQTVLRKSIGAGWGAWDLWRAGKSSPTGKVIDRIYTYMANHPPPQAADAA